mmetsp:Transcript_11530/g.26763  ORF Transcript_11530/g.26763 Transcript_11530/m.26763 type:complete len:205 (-) Transcript_11530:1938-2552(-)
MAWNQTLLSLVGMLVPTLALSSSTTPAGRTPDNFEHARSNSCANFSSASRFASFLASTASVNEVETRFRTLPQTSASKVCAAELDGRSVQSGSTSCMCFNKTWGFMFASFPNSASAIPRCAHGKLSRNFARKADVWSAGTPNCCLASSKSCTNLLRLVSFWSSPAALAFSTDSSMRESMVREIASTRSCSIRDLGTDDQIAATS